MLLKPTNLQILDKNINTTRYIKNYYKIIII
jgi:hypothetical protein